MQTAAGIPGQTLAPLYDGLLPSQRRPCSTLRMGEIFIDGDVWAARMLVPVAVYAPGFPQRSLMLSGMIDTGATHTAILPEIAQMLGLPFESPAYMSGAGASGMSARFSASLEIWRQDFSDQCAALWPKMTLSSLLSAPGGVALLIGMDILQGSTTTLNPDGRWTLKFAN